MEKETVSIAIAISALIATTINIYASHFRKPKLFGKILGHEHKFENFGIDTAINFLQEMTHIKGYGYAFLLNLVSQHNDILIKDVKVFIKEKNHDFEKEGHLYFFQEDIERHKHESLTHLSLLEKNKHKYCIIKFIIESDNCASRHDSDLEGLKLVIEDFNNNKYEIEFKVEDINQSHVIPIF